MIMHRAEYLLFWCLLFSNGDVIEKKRKTHAAYKANPR